VPQMHQKFFAHHAAAYLSVKFAEQARRSGDKIEIIYDQYGANNWQWKS
jgi:hypothetical protein